LLAFGRLRTAMAIPTKSFVSHRTGGTGLNETRTNSFSEDLLVKLAPAVKTPCHFK
jgi:hypothetical protein